MPVAEINFLCIQQVVSFIDRFKRILAAYAHTIIAAVYFCPRPKADSLILPGTTAPRKRKHHSIADNDALASDTATAEH